MHPYDGRVVTNFIVQALQGEDLTLYGDGSQTRSFCYVDDLVDVIMAHMNNEPESGDPRDAFVGPVNIGNPGEFTIKQLAEKIIELTGSDAELTTLPLPKDDPLQRKPDIRLAKQELGWEPKVPLEEGLRKTIDYFRRVDLDSFRRPTDHTAHKNSDASRI
jgi:UDP-glucuronate decarboxylase